jgi:hypothetical protein
VVDRQPASPIQLSRLLHRVQDDPDQDVDDDEDRDQDEGHEVDPRPLVHFHPGLHVTREVLEREQHEEAQHGSADVAPVSRQLLGE